jgi:heme-degrading monooxygenase HmoA
MQYARRVRYRIAQLNIGTVRYPLESAEMHGFVSALDEINALAESSPGFRWRLTGDGNDATSLRPYDDDRIIVNMSVWDNLETLKNYVYNSAHTDYLRRRKEWFAAMRDAYTVLWWIPEGHTPTVAEAVERLEHLRAHGSTPYAFAFREPHPAPEQ